MFASSMKILTLNRNNTSPQTVESDSEGQSVTKVLNSSSNHNEIGGSGAGSGLPHKTNKRDQKHKNKTKFVHGNSNKVQQHLTQQTQKYHHKNSSNNNNSNSGNKHKNQHYCNINSNNNNNNTNTSTNRKKYYQQPQHHQNYQQQHYITDVNSSPANATITINNNNNFAKNQNCPNTDLLTQQQKPKQQQHQLSQSNVVKNLVNFSTNLAECTCLLQHSNYDTTSLTSFSSDCSVAASEQTNKIDDFQSNTLCYDNRLKITKTSNSQNAPSNEVQISGNTAPTCISCWKNLNKFPEQLQPEIAINFATSNTKALSNNCDRNEILTKSTSKSSVVSLSTHPACQSKLSNTATSSSALKRKSHWKNANTSAAILNAVGAEVNRNLLSASEYSIGGTSSTFSPKLSKEKQNNVSDSHSCNTNKSKNVEENTNQNSNEEIYSAKLNPTTASNQQTQISKHQIQAKGKIEMTTTTSVASNTTNTFNCKTSTNHELKSQQAKLGIPNDATDLMLKTIANNINCNGGINKAITTNSSSSQNTCLVTSSQNSYTLDFLHSVGVKMTGGVPLRSSDTQGTTKAYENQDAAKSAIHNACPYTGMSANQRQSRYMYNGSNSNSGNNGNQLHHYHHHHQPSQLTIASFLHKDLLEGDKTPTGTNSSRENASSNSRNVNHSQDHQQQTHYAQQQQQNNARFHQTYNAAAFQQQSAAVQHTNYGGAGGGGYNGTHRNSEYVYPNYPNSSGEHGMGKSNNNTMTQLHSRQLKNNLGNFKNSLNTPQVTKKTTYASSTTSNGSLYSSKSFASNSSNISNRQMQTKLNQDSKKGSSNLNLAIETLPSKMLHGGNQRGSHRGHHSNHHGHHYGKQYLMMNSPTVLQHQNYYNLTYVTTDTSANRAVTSRAASPAAQSLPSSSLPPTNCNSPKTLDQSPIHSAMMANFNGAQLQYPRYQRNQLLAAQHHQQFHQYSRQQQPNILNKKVLVPLSLALSSPSPSPTLTSNAQQEPPHNIICCSQLDEASTAAAAAAANSFSSLGIATGKDYDSDNSSSHSFSRIKYQSRNSSISSSSSASITSNKPQHVQQQTCPATSVTCTQTTPLHSPIDYCATTCQQVFAKLQEGQHPQFYGNNGGIVSLLNLATPNNFSEEDYLQQQPLVLSASSPDHFNITVANHSNRSSGYWSPSFHQNNQFIYHQFSSAPTAHAPPITSSSSSCGSSSASISPGLPNYDIQCQQNLQPLQSNSECMADMSPSYCSSTSKEATGSVITGNLSNLDSTDVLAASSGSSSSSSVSGLSINSTNGGGYKSNTRTSELMGQQKHHLTSQAICQSSSSSASSLSNATVSTLTSTARARNGIGVSTLTENSISGSQHLPPTATQHFYSHHQSLPPPLPPHNLLYNNPQIHHIRTLSALSSSSVHDFFTHTPPDRFLARAHLIEAKEAPPSLLNNSKFDRLSQSIWKKFINSQQTEETFKQKMRLWRYLYVFIKNTYPRYGLYLVGSTISGFGSDSSDVDMCLVSRSASSIDPRLEALYNLTILRDCLSKSGQFENFNLIEAKVPILRFSDRMHQLEVDLNFNNCVGIKNTHLLYCYSQLDWRLRPLVLVTKLWAQHHDINNAKNMTISSYSLVLMVIHFLQFAVNPPVLPCLHDIFPDKFPLLRSNDFGYVDMNETIGPFETKNNQSIGELFLAFLDYYACFDYKQYAISVRTGGLLPINVCRVAKSIKNDIHQWKELCIEEPFDLTNTARSVYDSDTFERVKAVFKESRKILRETLDLNSVFSTILLPSSSSIECLNLQRSTNPPMYTTVFHEVEAAGIDANDTEIDYEQYGHKLRVVTTAHDEYKSLGYINEESVVKEGSDYINEESGKNEIITNSALINATTTAHKMHPFKDLHQTPRQVKEFTFSPISLSSTTAFNTGSKNVNGNSNASNSRTVSALAS